MNRYTAFVIVFWLAGFVGVAPAHAQRSDMYQAVGRVAIVGKAALAKGYQFLDIGTLFGTLLRNGQRVDETFQLQAGKRYAFIAGGDDDARDVDLYLYDSGGRLVGKDTDRTASAVVAFQPRVSGRYRVVLTLPSSRTNESFCALSVLTTDRQHGFELRTESLLDTLKSLETSFQVVERVMEERGDDVDLRFHSGTNTWLLMGAILHHKTAVGSDPKYFAPASYLGICVGEASCSDVNLYVRTPTGRTLVRGTDTGKCSFAAFAGGSQDLLSLSMENAYSRRPSLVLSAVLRVIPQ